VRSFLVGVTGLLPPWWRRWLATPFVVLEVEASTSDISHRLWAPAPCVPAVEQLLLASLPGVRFERVQVVTHPVRTAIEYRLSDRHRPLRTDADGISSKLLTSLQPLGAGEGVLVQWVLAPAPPARVITASSPKHVSWFGRAWPTEPSRDDAAARTALRAKHAHPLLLGVARIGATAATDRSARRLVRRSEVAFHGSRAPGAHLRRRLLPSALLTRRLTGRQQPAIEWPGLFNVDELAGLIGWPIGPQQIPGLSLAAGRLLAPSRAVPTRGTVVAGSTWPGSARPIALDLEARLRHVHVVGPTGTGKSTLLANMIASDLDHGFGLVVVDPKGDLIADVLERMPTSRLDDVVVLDPADTGRPVGLNPLRAAAGASSEVVVENLVGLFKSLYRSSWGPRTDDIFRAALSTLASTSNATLCEVPLLLTDASYRRRIVGALDDPVGLESFWGWYEALSDGERLSVVGPVLNKVRAFSMRPTVRAIVGQADPSLELRDVLASGKVLLVSLASGLLGEEAANLLGALVVAELWHATTGRAALLPAARRPVMAYLDEWQHFLHLPTPMASVLAEARGLGLGLTLAHQHLGQLPDSARDAVMANARSRVVFQLPSGDARIVARELSGYLSPDDLQGLGAYEVVVQAFANGSTQPPATGRTRPMPPVSSDADAIRRASRLRYGVDRVEVDSAIRARQLGQLATTTVRRRPSSRSRSAP
jgi:Helicase HerA, central domain